MWQIEVVGNKVNLRKKLPMLKILITVSTISVFNSCIKLEKLYAKVHSVQITDQRFRSFQLVCGFNKHLEYLNFTLSYQLA